MNSSDLLKMQCTVYAYIRCVSLAYIIIPFFFLRVVSLLNIYFHYFHYSIWHEKKKQKTALPSLFDWSGIFQEGYNW